MLNTSILTEIIFNLVKRYPIQFIVLLISLGTFLGFVFFKYRSDVGTTDVGEVLPKNEDSEYEALVNTYKLVDVSGAVKNPGVYSLEDSSRYVDVLSEAGGYSDSVDLDWVRKNINLSKTISDGEKIYIPYSWESSVTTSISYGESNNVTDSNSDDSSNSSIVNVNTGSAEELNSLPGIGEVLADRIIKNRPYQDITELANKAELSSSVTGKITSFVTF